MHAARLKRVDKSFNKTRFELANEKTKVEGLEEEVGKHKEKLKDSEEIAKAKEAELTRIQEERGKKEEELREVETETTSLHERVKELSQEVELAGPAYVKSVEYEKELAFELVAFYQQAMCIGAKQAIRRYKHIDLRIVYFRLDYEDDMNEPEVEPELEVEDEANMDVLTPLEEG